MPIQRLIFLNRFYWPDEPATAQVLTDLAEMLAAEGNDMTVISSHNGAVETPYEETRNRVKILRVRSTRWGGGSLPGRTIDFATYLIGARRHLKQIVHAGDLVVAMTDPPVLPLAVASLAKKRGAKVVHWVQDIYPELATALGGPGFLGLLRPWRDHAWRNAQACVALGEDMAAFVKQRGARNVAVIPNWSPIGLGKPSAKSIDELRAEWELQNKFVVTYAGNLGRVHDLSPILEAASALRHTPGISFIFVGDGAQRRALEAEALRLDLSNVRFFPPQPRARLAEVLALGDVHLVTLKSGCERFVFPSKFYGIVAVGRPILFVGPSQCEVARLVSRKKLGLIFSHNEMPRLAQALLDLKNNTVQRTVWQEAAIKFHREMQYPKDSLHAWRDLLHDVCGAPGSR
ncbi:MAG: glycosyltransferase family 4 protein, partial [Verrucomicrobiota bacterium]|nr:glycosyltransferase family 4 protein [Verrucomicrobiota bacterium]